MTVLLVGDRFADLLGDGRGASHHPLLDVASRGREIQSLCDEADSGQFARPLAAVALIRQHGQTTAEWSKTLHLALNWAATAGLCDRWRHGAVFCDALEMESPNGPKLESYLRGDVMRALLGQTPLFAEGAYPDILTDHDAFGDRLMMVHLARHIAEHEFAEPVRVLAQALGQRRACGLYRELGDAGAAFDARLNAMGLGGWNELYTDVLLGRFAAYAQPLATPDALGDVEAYRDAFLCAAWRAGAGHYDTAADEPDSA